MSTPTPRTDAAWEASFSPEKPSFSVLDCARTLETELAALTAERDQLRSVFPQICAAIGNGAFCTPAVSIGFIESIPNEVQLVVAELRERAKRAEAELAAERARLEYLSLSMGTPRIADALNCEYSKVSPIRAAIDAAMKEAAK